MVDGMCVQYPCYGAGRSVAVQGSTTKVEHIAPALLFVTYFRFTLYLVALVLL